VLAPRRALRPDEAKGYLSFCPFFLGRENEEQEVYRVGGENGDANWQIRVVPNKFPFAPIHEVIIHSPDHHKNFEELALSQVELIFQTYRQRFQTHKDKGQVYVFHNRGAKGGESLPHPHTQLVVVPNDVTLNIPRLAIGNELEEVARDQVVYESKYFQLFCPKTSQWPDEVWIHPKRTSSFFYEVSDDEISDLSFVVKRLIQIFSIRHGKEFPFNFYIYPGKDWYLRLIPRDKSLGGFEIGTGIFINTQDPQETIDFIKRHFEEGSENEINKATYGRSV
jgi:UDPglucose--hexose-1-phosphate uridylyltransferase